MVPDGNRPCMVAWMLEGGPRLVPPSGAELDVQGRIELACATERWGLTTREAEVLELLAEGEGNKCIARRLGVAPRTVEVHVGAILRKAKADSRARLVALFWTRR